ncbi:MAG TPA: hypothetical protein VEU76_01020 [Candidatus Udaeobacter sp.]|nr:hypothetical protein [Candidatus Udaeobacter sp.]
MIRRWGRRGATVVEAVSLGLAARDAAMIVSGVPRRLRPGPAVLLWLELGSAVAAAVTGAPLALGYAPPQMHPLEIARRAAVGALFGLHTLRFGIYLGPGRGVRQPAA